MAGAGTSRTQQALQRERRARQAAEDIEWAARSRNGQDLFAPVLAGVARIRPPVWEALLQADTAVRKAANSLTLGAADKLDAGLDSVFAKGNFSSYRGNAQANTARNQYDAVHRRNAQMAGDIGATALMFSRAPASLAAKAPQRIAGAVKMSKRELGALAAGGGLTNAAIQNFANATRGKQTTWQEWVGALTGGAAGVLAYPLGPQRAGAVGGATSSATEDLLSGRRADLEALAQNAVLGRLAGGLGGVVGTRGSDALSSRAKGKLGETIGALRTDLNGMPIEPGPKRLELRAPGAKKGGTIVDGRSGDVRFEYKFGRNARLSNGQRAAQELLGGNYKIYQFLPEDIGQMLSIPTLGISRPFYNDRRQ